MSASKFKPPKGKNQNSKTRQTEMTKRLKKLMEMKNEGEFKTALAEVLNIYPGTTEYEAIVIAWRAAQ
jgi:hypothetical protein